jgi:hypothetical protein
MSPRESAMDVSKRLGPKESLAFGAGLLEGQPSRPAAQLVRARVKFHVARPASRTRAGGVVDRGIESTPDSGRAGGSSEA